MLPLFWVNVLIVMHKPCLQIDKSLPADVMFCRCQRLIDAMYQLVMSCSILRGSSFPLLLSTVMLCDCKIVSMYHCHSVSDLDC